MTRPLAHAPVRTDLPGGLSTLEHEVAVPLDHGRPDGEQLVLFAREVRRTGPAADRLPFLVFLQGGPGSEAPRPTVGPTSPGWLDLVLPHFRVLLLDQRGTGRSSPVGPATIAGTDPTVAAERLTHFRADSVVADCELLRAHLGVERWSVLGQSFGGFCVLHYLCVAPHALATTYLTGGVPAVATGLPEIYAATYTTIRGRNHLFHERYPADRARLERLLDLVDLGDLRTPDGGAVGRRRLQSVGSVLGMSYGAERLHHLLELDPASPAFAHDLADLVPWHGRNPLYAVLQESCHADGVVTGWAARASMPADFADDPTLLTGEHVLPEHLADDPGLAAYADVAEHLAHHPWPRLYDEDALAACTVPTAAVLYEHDPYVDLGLARRTAELTPAMRVWTTPDREHDALRTAPDVVVPRLLELAPPPP